MIVHPPFNFRFSGFMNMAIVFDTVNNNIGNGYNATSGMFTAPTDGVYVFSTTILTCPGCVASVGLIKNDDDFISGLYVNGAPDKLPSTAETTVLELTRGDQMRVKIADAEDEAPIPQRLLASCCGRRLRRPISPSPRLHNKPWSGNKPTDICVEVTWGRNTTRCPSRNTFEPSCHGEIHRYVHLQ